MFQRKWGLLACALILLLPCLAHAAQQVALGLVNTSVGLKPTSAKNKFKLETDPVLHAIPGIVASGTPADYIPVEGLLNSHFDPTQFQLDTDPGTGTYSLGATVAGVLPFQVVGFQVQTIDGGLINVQDNGSGGDAYSQITSGPFDPTNGPVGGGASGNVYDIHFKIINDEQGLALTSDQDQNFYDLFLTQIGNNPPGYDSTFITPDSFVTFAPSDAGSGLGLSNETVTAPDITGAVVPEVSTAGFLGLAGITLFLRRRRAKRESLALELLQSQTPPPR